ncbi:formylglycine-generating enzyme family protein [Streptomyces sp. NBC_01092]|uniref:formylglycine-generating enzyme family protein n=1 Tax=Streptomyces sp. NBC_01092 TaxID=2903748 RepID=UPI003866C9B1|nr:formylglycine-generating enzyme family protein [Streptomyces sp. NBC_01092]
MARSDRSSPAARETIPEAKGHRGASGRSPKNMVWIPAGHFLMGSEDFYPEEGPVHRRAVQGLWVDHHPVTNAEFRRFVKDTGHVTTAETAPDAAEYPGASDDQLVPGSLVFTPAQWSGAAARLPAVVVVGP